MPCHFSVRGTQRVMAFPNAVSPTNSMAHTKGGSLLEAAFASWLWKLTLTLSASAGGISDSFTAFRYYTAAIIDTMCLSGGTAK